MPNGLPCPQLDQLARLANGEWTGTEADSICDHVQSCSTCTAILAEILDDESMVGSMVGSIRCTTSIKDTMDDEDREAVGLLMTRLRFLPRYTKLSSASGTEKETDHDCVADTGVERLRHESDSEVEFNQLIRDFLSPPESRMEVGRLGSYRVFRRLGSGGMGIVLEAEDTQLGRTVALKVMQPRLLHNESNRRRFLQEARAVAALEHDHIVPIYQVGEERGIPFLVMPLLKGESLDSRLRRDGQLPIGHAVEIGLQIAMGLAAAHQQGVVHRDIKPANIWMEERAFGDSNSTHDSIRVKILDFGLARDDRERVPLTEPGVITGTPEFMAPEQALGERADARSDLFSLGCVLYFISSGRLPFVGRNSVSIMLSVLENKPVPLREIVPNAPEKFVALVMRLLQRESNRRFETAQEVVEVLRTIVCEKKRLVVRIKGSEPLGDHSKNVDEWKRWGIGGTFAILLLAGLIWLASGLIFKVQTAEGTIVLEMDSSTADGANVYVDNQHTITIRFKEDAEPLEIKAGPGKHKLRVAKGGFKLFTQEFNLMDGQREKMRVHLEPLTEDIGSKEKGSDLHTQNNVKSNVPSEMNVETIALQGLVPRPGSRAGYRRWQIESKMPRGEIPSLAWEPSGQRIACGSANGYVRLIDVRSSTLQQLIPAHTGTVWSIDWKRNASELVTGGEDGVVRLYNSDGRYIRRLGIHLGRVTTIKFSPDGEWVASAGLDSIIRLWRTTGEAGPTLQGHTSQIDAIQWHPSGTKLASSSWDGTMRIWNVDAGASTEIRVKGNGILGFAWNPKGDMLATAGLDGSIRLLKINGEEHAAMPAHADGATAIAIAWSAGDILASGGHDGIVRLWRNGEEPLKSVELGSGYIKSLRWSDDGIRLAIVTESQIRFLNESGESMGGISNGTAPIRSVAWNKAGKLASTGDDATVRLWNQDGTQSAISREHTKEAFSVSWHRSGNQIVSGGWDQNVQVWNLETEKKQTLHGHDPVAWNPVGEEVAWTLGKDVLVGTPGQTPQLFRGHTSVVLGIAWNPAGTQLASSDGTGEIRIWNRDGSAGPVMRAEGGLVAMKWHPEQSLLATASLTSGNIQLWDGNGQLRSTWKTHSQGILSLAWSPDGEQILSTSNDQTIRITKLDGSTVGELRSSHSIGNSVDWDPINNRIATAHSDGIIHIWDGHSLGRLSTTQLFNDGNWVRFDSKGDSISSEGAILDSRLILIAEDDMGLVHLMKPSTVP